MERILNEDERIRRAEELYYRRNNHDNNIIEKESNKKRGYLRNKIILHLLIMFNIAVIVFCLQNKEFIFTQEFINILNKYNVDISSKIVNFVGSIVNSENIESDIQKEETVENSITNTNIESIDENNNNLVNDIVPNEISSSSINEMEQDINNLNFAYSFIKPLSGTVTSVFGARVSENPNINGYHTGIDIANEKGKIIKASMQGIVELVSDKGDYGNHIKIRCNNVTTLYAHCSTILIKEGQIVAQGQDIATVGSTGNSTGPHLHFEIRIDDRFVDPGKIISF